jgi:hypothetical protein
MTVSIEALFDTVPVSLHPRSGKVFYSGRDAFSGPSPLYVLGINPAGHPDNYENETIGLHSLKVMKEFPNLWNAYSQESWEGRPPGTYGMAPRILHMFTRLNLAPERVPCSNLIFVRSHSELDLKGQFEELAHDCWKFHNQVISLLKPKAVLCLGKSTGEYVRRQLDADVQVDEYREANKRGWASTIHVNLNLLKIISVTHPSRVDWQNPAADPTGLVASALQ